MHAIKRDYLLLRRVTGCCLRLCIVYLLLASVLVEERKCQFISYFSAKGIRGNVTFAVQSEESAEQSIVITASLESDGLLKPRGDQEQEDAESSLFYLDWTLHNNTLESQMLLTCSSDDLGREFTEIEKLSKDRPFTLDRTTQWFVPIVDLGLGTGVSVSDILWGKSISLKISDRYETKVSKIKTSQKESASVPVTNSTIAVGNSRLPTSLRKPGNITVTHPKPQVNQKHTFAPRPKPSISGRSKTSSTQKPVNSLPKAEALLWNPDTERLATESALSSSTTSISPSTSTTTKPASDLKPEQLSSYHKRLVRILGRAVMCANIIDTRDVKTAEAYFESQISGKITVRGNEDGTTIIILNLYNINSKISTRHDWKILASDILDNRRHDEQCNYLQLVFDPHNTEGTDCSTNDMKKCRQGDLTGKHGQLQVAGLGKSSRRTIVDHNLPISSLEVSRALFIAIYEPIGPGVIKRSNILTCAKLHISQPRKVEASFNSDGVRGSIGFSQRHASEPVTFYYNLYGLEGNVKLYSINSLPVGQRSKTDISHQCSNLGPIFNPLRVNVVDNPAVSTTDQYPAGNLSSKHGHLLVVDSDDDDHYINEHIDLSLQLYGSQSIVGRSIILRKNNQENWVCANLEYVDRRVNLAVATFHYPVVGRISFYQLSDEAHAETNVLVDVYDPNSNSNSHDHNWLIHLSPAMADFYNWSERCQSSGEVYDPLGASGSLKFDQYERQCLNSITGGETMRCRLGDASLKSGAKISLPTSAANKTRLYYTDTFLPLRNQHSIISRSVVIYDESSPKQRGNRLACSTIKLVHPLKASITSWNSGPSIPSAVRGYMKFEQESAAQSTRIEVNLDGLASNVENYAIHNAWTMDDREFPCSNDSLYDMYDPYDTEHSLSIPPSAHYGSSATVDRVKVGDLSRKHGTFEGLQSAQRSLVDSSTSLFAPKSIVGRSLVLRAKVNDFRWVCGNIELDYDRSETREIVGVASFDDHRSKVSGFVRFSQLEHKDGTLSDTYIHVDLREQPQQNSHEHRASEPHNWSIFVNQVGEDAFIAADDVRCIAAGFKWNPYLAQDTLESYSSSCNEKLSDHLACAMGDLGMRHGPIIVGPNNRLALSDSNLPLAGNYSVMGRSLIIFDAKKPSVKLACANILPDVHLKSNVVIKRTPSFTVSRFVEQMRTLLEATDWLLVPELRATKSVANGDCVQMTIHFYGRRAHQLQLELNNLITLGTVRRSTRTGVDTISTHYKLCRAAQPLNSKNLVGGSTAHRPDIVLECLMFSLSLIAIHLLLKTVIV